MAARIWHAESFGKPIIYKNYHAVPYNHWCEDTFWMVLLHMSALGPVSVFVTALTPEEAVIKAVDVYLEEIEDEL